MKRRILTVDDQKLSCDHLRQILEPEGYEIEAAYDGATALEMLRDQVFHLVVTDLKMPDMSGFELLSTLRERRVPVGVVVVTAYGDTSEALQTMKAGADDFLRKPYDAEHLRLVVERTLERRHLVDRLAQLRNQLRGTYSFHTMVSQSAKMRRIFDLIQHVGQVDSTVLIHGETGTGKELVAQALHAVNTRRKGKFVALNCAVLNDSLLESELFGHERGAFTGAEKRKIGRFEKADGGTLLLDEIGDISPAMQVKLLRVLQTGTLERVGGVEPIKVDVRIVAATHKRLEDEVKAGRFRADLYYRLKVVLIDMPPLRERKEDVALLAMHFVEKHASAANPITEIDSAAMQALLNHHWPGNIRELENAIKAAAAMAEGPVIHRDLLPETIAPRTPDAPHASPSLIDIDVRLPELIEELVGQVEREYFHRVLSEFDGNVARCARHSGLSRRSVTQKLQKYGLERQAFKKPKFE
ncbi:sigma-54-dependent transcriptional regulator [Planctomyces sp. SH-PL62]|uniref:sigma-54-dependent transcriptional regulator n=1 Tax=Planctomyces sp. SH-PL62 TaxID=1636152 RepID=UPI00078D5CA6|nr:sigma-54 dependent transcriptional regulator [Planctomyces sp. SH-PL62]AMV36727.1 Transcriptional regulatory protein ZraR [Planctomyces sp. SH-PL62]